ncbi:MAG TPA: hypothetical protein VFA20_04115 [Myxococcaceae bacterium]|nr:hypothetical protein [Myxococcaceae bacterium]
MVRTLAAAALSVFCSLPTMAQAAGPVAPPPPPPAPAFEPPPAPPAPNPVSPQAPQGPPQSMPGKMPHVRFYAGGAGVNQASSGNGGAGLLGIQWYGDLFPIIQWYWGVELDGVGVGSGFLALVDGDLGARLTPFPDWPLRPYLRANVGMSVLVILPIPSAGIAVGMILPIFNTIFLDIALGGRRAYDVFDTTKSIDFGVMELSIGF